LGKNDEKHLAPPEIFSPPPPPGYVGLAAALILWSESVNFLAPENKITLKENSFFPQKF